MSYIVFSQNGFCIKLVHYVLTYIILESGRVTAVEIYSRISGYRLNGGVPI